MSTIQSMLKIVMVVGDYPPIIGGVGDYTACLSKALVKMGVSVTVVTTHISGCANIESDNGVDIHRGVNGWFMSDIEYILNVIDQKGPKTIVHIQYDCPMTYGRKLMINILPIIIRVLRPKCHVIVTIHGFHERKLLARLRVLPMVLAPSALILVNEKDRQSLSHMIRRRKLPTDVIPISSNIPVAPENLKSIAMLRETFGYSRDDVIVGFFGGIRPDKGFLDLVYSLQKVRLVHKSLRLLLIGGFEYPTEANSRYGLIVKDLLNQAGKSKWITIAKAPEPEKVSRLLQLADLAVFPFTNGASENRGSILAAIAHGLPTITTRGTNTPDAFEKDFGVETVPAGNQKKLVDRIAALVQSPEARKELSRRSFLASSRFSWDTIASQTISLYESICCFQ